MMLCCCTGGARGTGKAWGAAALAPHKTVARSSNLRRKHGEAQLKPRAPFLTCQVVTFTRERCPHLGGGPEPGTGHRYQGRAREGVVRTEPEREMAESAATPASARMIAVALTSKAFLSARESKMIWGWNR